MKRKYWNVLICLLIICGISIFPLQVFSQEEPPSPAPEELSEELINEMLGDEYVPEEIKKELEKMLRSGEFKSDEEEPAEVPPAEEVYPPPVMEEEPKEEVEVEELERPTYREAGPARTSPKVVSHAKANRISLDLKGVDIIDVLKMLSARANLNIVAGRNVRGRVTLFLKDVDVWDAFEIILAANDLAYEKDGDIINVMTERDYEQLYGEKYYTKKDLQIFRLEYAQASEVSKALNQAKSKIGKVIVDEGSNTVAVIDSSKAIAQMEKMIAEMDTPIETKIFSLNYAKAEDVKTKLSEILTKGVGTIQVDERTNKIVITDLLEKMPEITNVISEMDEKHKEVLIETKIIEISLTDQYQYGVDWKSLFRDAGDQGIRFSFNNLGDVMGGTGSNITGGTVTLASVASRNITGAIELLKTVGKTNVLSCPRITVLNNEEAKVLVGTNQPYVEQTYISTEAGDDRTDETIKWIDLGVELTVTPTINRDGYVTMKVKPKISSSTTSLEGTSDRLNIPIVSTSETETTVMVRDGTTIIIAGLIEDRDQLTENKVPILGDIPIIGNLFKNKTVGSAGTTDLPEKKELVVFLTPYIIHGTETFPEAENIWYGERITQRELLEQQMSLAVEDLEKKRSLVGEIPPPEVEEEKDTTTHISRDIDWFGDLKEKLKMARVPEEEAAEARPVEVAKGEKVAEGEVPERETIMPPHIIPPSISAYYSYYAKLRNKIYWFAKDSYPKALKGKKEDVSLLFTLTNDGRLKEEPKVLNEVDRELALAAKSAVRRAAPFPPFPKRIKKNEENFKITITYQ